MGDEDVIPQAEGSRAVELEGQHTPVDEVGAVALGGVLVDDVGPGPQHALAAGGLLTGRAVAGLDGKNGGGQLHIVPGQGLAAGHGTDLCQQGSIPLPGPAGGFLGLHGLGAPHIGGVLAAEGELGQTQGVGAVGRGLTRGDELVRGGDGVGDVGGHLQQQVVAQRGDLGPVLDVGAQLEQGIVIAVAKALIHPGLVAGGVVVIFGHGGVVIHLRCGGQDAAVGRGGGNAAGIHQGHACQLAAAGLGALAAGEVAGGVADGQRPVGRHIARAEAGAAEGRADGGTAGHQVGQHAGAVQLHHNGLAAGVNAEGVVPAAAGVALEDGSGLVDAVKQAARAACDDSLIHPEPAVFDLAAQIQLHVRAAHQLLDVLLAFVEDVLEVGVQLLDGKGVGGVHGQGDHGPDLGKVHAHHAIVVGQLCRVQGLVVPCPAMDREVLPGLFIGLPDGGKAGGLGGHGINGVAGVLPQGGDAGAHELHDLVLDIAALEQLTHQCNGHIVGAAACGQSAGQADGHHAGAGHIVGAAQQLLCQLAAALADGHGAQRTVAGVGIGAKDHFAAARKALAHVLVDDRHVGRHKDAAVLFGSGQAEAVVILVDGAAHSAQAVVAVGQHIGDGELFQPRGAGRLDDAHKGDVVACHGIEPDPEIPVAAAGVVGGEDAVGHGALVGLAGLLRSHARGCQCRRSLRVGGHPLPPQVVCTRGAAFDRFQHNTFPSLLQKRGCCQPL